MVKGEWGKYYPLYLQQSTDHTTFSVLYFMAPAQQSCQLVVVSASWSSMHKTFASQVHKDNAVLRN